MSIRAPFLGHFIVVKCMDGSRGAKTSVLARLLHKRGLGFLLGCAWLVGAERTCRDRRGSGNAPTALCLTYNGGRTISLGKPISPSVFPEDSLAGVSLGKSSGFPCNLLNGFPRFSLSKRLDLQACSRGLLTDRMRCAGSMPLGDDGRHAPPLGNPFHPGFSLLDFPQLSFGGWTPLSIQQEGPLLLLLPDLTLNPLRSLAPPHSPVNSSC